MAKKKETVTNELMYEVLKQLQTGQAKTHQLIGDMKAEIISLRKQVHGLQGDSIRRDSTMAELSVQVDRISTRLDFKDA